MHAHLTDGRTYLLVLCLSHSPKHPYYPIAVGHLGDEPELPLRAVRLARALAEEKLEEPFRHV